MGLQSQSQWMHHKSQPSIRKLPRLVEPSPAIRSRICLRPGGTSFNWFNWLPGFLVTDLRQQEGAATIFPARRDPAGQEPEPESSQRRTVLSLLRMAVNIIRIPFPLTVSARSVRCGVELPLSRRTKIRSTTSKLFPMDMTRRVAASAERRFRSPPKVARIAIMAVFSSGGIVPA